MTLAPRVEVYTQIACRTLHNLPMISPDTVPSSPLHPPGSLVHTSDTVHVQFQNAPVKTYDECSGDPKVQARAARIQACRPSFSPSLTSIRPTLLHSRQDHGKHPQCRDNRLAESSKRQIWTQRDSCSFDVWRPLHVCHTFQEPCALADFYQGTSSIYSFLTSQPYLEDMVKPSSLLHRLLKVFLGRSRPITASLTRMRSQRLSE